MKKKQQENINIKRYSPAIDNGLSAEQVNERVGAGLINQVKEKNSKSYLNIFVNNVCTFFNLLGLIVFIAMLSIGSYAHLSDYFFVFFYIANMTIGIVQEIRAKHCIDKLTLATSKSTKVLRDGVVSDISPKDIVLDDIIVLGIGNQIPTDCQILEGEIEVNESLLTGESVPVKKKPGDMLYESSFITSGNCKTQAVKVGKDNYIEILSAKAKKYKQPHSEIMTSLKTIIKGISFVIVVIAILFMVKSLVFKHASYPEAIMGTSTVVIGMIPAGMFLLTSIALAVGIIKLAKHNTLVQDLYSLEMLARVDTICFDKTGTITDGKMTVTDVVELQQCNDCIDDIISSMLSSLKDNNQTAIALEHKFGDKQVLTPVKTLPFNSKRKLSAVTFKDKGTYAFGAPEFVLNKEEFVKYRQIIEDYAKKGLRVLIVAHSDKSLEDDFIPTDFTAIATIAIADNIREDAKDTIKWFKENNVAIKVISGDNPITVSEVSKRVGVENADKYISLEGMSDDEVFNIANDYTIFGRVSPEQKAILVKALKNAGHVTAMTGDGVNDILALKEADCAISVAAGSEAARNVSHLVLLDNNFNSMPEIVHEGRRVINNVQSSASLFLMKTFFTMLMAIITLSMSHFDSYPYRLSNMIMFEVFITGIPSFLLSFQPNDARVEGRFISHVIKSSLPSALLMTLSVLFVELFYIFFKDNFVFGREVYSTMGIYVLTFAGAINLFMICRPFNKFRTVVFTSSLIIVLIITALSQIECFGNILSLVPMLPVKTYWTHLLVILGIILIDIPLALLLNRLFKNFDVAKIYDNIKNRKKKAN